MMMMMMKTTGMSRLSPLAVSYRSTSRSIGRSGMELLSVLLLLLLSSSSMVHHPGVAAEEDVDDVLLVDQRAFADDIVNDLYNSTTTKNQCTSALGLSMMMSLLYPAMSDAAQLEAQEVFGFPTLSADDDATEQLVWAELTNDINQRYDGACLPAPAADDECSFGANPLVSIANSVWTQTGKVLDADYAAVVRDANLTKELDFASQEAGATINAWVNDTTRGVIEKLFDDGPLPPAVVLIVINAIYLKASWRKPFYAERTSVDVFYTADRSTVQRSEAIFMHQLDYFPYSSTAVDNYQIVQLPFDNTLSMILAVPVVKNAPLTNASAVLEALPQLESQQRVALALPKFQFEREYLNDLKAAMLNAGVNLPFGPGHLCVYENDCSPALEIVIQKTFISVDEKGVVAAAVTTGIATSSLPTDTPVEVMADLPFQFYIIDDTTSSSVVVLFEGRVFDPTPQDTTAALTARHTDADFWSENFGYNATRIFDDSPVAAPVAMPTTAPEIAPVAGPPAPVTAPTTIITPVVPTAAPVMVSPMAAPVVAGPPITAPTAITTPVVPTKPVMDPPTASASTVVSMAISAALLFSVVLTWNL